MTTYAYRARTLAGELVRGVRAARTEGELRTQLRDEGLFLLKVKSEGRKSSGGSLGRVKRKEVILFTFHLQNVVDAGIPILSGLEDLAEETSDSRLKAVVQDVIDSLTGGETLHQAMSHHPSAFDSQYVSMIEAGEQTGNLAEVLGRIVHLLEWQEELKRSIRELTTYPVVVLFGLVGLVAVVLGFVFPRFADIFVRVNFELPLPTRILMGFSSFLTSYWLWIVIAGLGLWGGAFALSRVDKVRLKVDQWVLRVPVVGDLISMINFGQVAQSLSSFVDSGITIPRSLELISRMVPNRAIGRSLIEAREALLAGETLTGAFRATGLFPPLVLRMLAMGEQSGRLVSSLEKAGSIYDREIPVLTKRVFDLMNPLITAFMGGMLLFVIISVMTPLYKMYQSIGTSY